MSVIRFVPTFPCGKHGQFVRTCTHKFLLGFFRIVFIPIRASENLTCRGKACGDREDVVETSAFLAFKNHAADHRLHMKFLHAQTVLRDFSVCADRAEQFEMSLRIHPRIFCRSVDEIESDDFFERIAEATQTQQHLIEREAQDFGFEESVTTLELFAREQTMTDAVFRPSRASLALIATGTRVLGHLQSGHGDIDVHRGLDETRVDHMTNTIDCE